MCTNESLSPLLKNVVVVERLVSTVVHVRTVGDGIEL